MRKLIALLLCLAVVSAFAACANPQAPVSGGGAGTDPATEPAGEETTEPEVTEPATGPATTPETVTITTLNGSQEPVELEVPYNPQRIAVLDMASLDILDALGVAQGRVVGSASTSLDYLQGYVTDSSIANLGTIKEADLEAVMACEPDIIFIGGRLSASYDDLSQIAPVVYLATDTELGVVESVRAECQYHCFHFWTGRAGPHGGI